MNILNNFNKFAARQGLQTRESWTQPTKSISAPITNTTPTRGTVVNTSTTPVEPPSMITARGLSFPTTGDSYRDATLKHLIEMEGLGTKDNRQIYKDTNGRLTLPGGVQITPYITKFLRKQGLTQPLTLGTKINDNLIYKSMQQYFNNPANLNIRNVQGFSTLPRQLQETLLSANYQAASMGNWPKLTKAIKANDYRAIARELKDSEAYRKYTNRWNNYYNAFNNYKAN